MLLRGRVGRVCGLSAAEVVEEFAHTHSTLTHLWQLTASCLVRREHYAIGLRLLMLLVLVGSKFNPLRMFLLLLNNQNEP